MRNIRRELNKAFAAYSQSSPDKTIATGKWGCGAFGGDPQLKFLIQWMVVSVLGRPMMFHTFQDNNKLESLTEITTKYLNGKSVGDLYNLLRRFSKGTSEFNVFDSISKMIVEDEEQDQKSKRLQRHEDQVML